MEKKSKEVKMTTVKKDEKLTYEQLEHVAKDLNMQRNQLAIQLQNAQRVISEFSDLTMLLSIIGKAEYFNEAFISRCVNKVETLVNRALDNSEKAEEKAEEKE